MKSFILALALVMGSVVFAETSEEVVLVDSTRCDVRVGFGFTSFSDRCSFNEVMVGIEKGDPMRIRCARLEVTCPNLNKSELNEETKQD